MQEPERRTSASTAAEAVNGESGAAKDNKRVPGYVIRLEGK